MVWGGGAEGEDCRRARGGAQGRLLVETVVVYGRGLGGCSGFRGGGWARGGRRLGDWSRPGQVAVLYDDHATNRLVLRVEEVLTLLLRGLRPHGHEKLHLVVGVEGRRCVGEAAVHIGVPDALDPVRGDDELVGNGGGDVAACGRGEVHGHGPGFHALDHVVLDQHGSLPSGNLCRRDDNVHLLALFSKHAVRGLEPLLRHLLGVAPGTRALLFKIHF
mmetsp:Transcript_14691/g.43516  ORF Transcript_14691/g.43516 Transcript_14691/m.43516 type:complete len:218 (+) Transcript_14691:2071-2724(+)